MTDNVNRISLNLDGNKPQQQTSASIVNLNDEDVVKIWDAVSAYIESYMKQSKGVIIPGFGTFSFIHKRIDVGNNKYLLLQRPVFALSERIAQTHGLKFTRYPVNGSIPVHPLNYFYIQSQSSYTRNQIEQCVKHVLQVFNRSIVAQRNVEFTFAHIGKLQIRDGKVKMRFFKDFVSTVDENAAKHVIENMCNRPQTSDSVMSAREAARPPTASNVVLPRLNSRIGNPSMQAIEEENPTDDEQEDHHPVPEGIQRDLIQSQNDIHHSNSRLDDLKLPSLSDLTGESNPSIISPHVVKTTGTTQEAIIPIASLFSSMDLIQPSTTRKKSPSLYTPLKRAKTSFYQTEHDHEQATINPAPQNTVVGQPTNEMTSAFGVTRISSSFNAHSQLTKAKSMTSCGHHGHGQDLCRVCQQRAKRNIPVYLHDEKRNREAEDAKLLEQYQHNRDVEEHRKQETAIKAAREEKQRIAAYNIGIADAARAKKFERPQTTDIPRSIIFRKRAKTPPSYLRQQDFARQLEAQIKCKQDEQRSEKRDKDFVERLEQIQLAESLTQERENYMKNKRLHQEEIKSALDNQIRNKPSEMSTTENTTPYFGLNDMSIEKLQERRLHAMDIVRQQKDLIEQRQRQQLLKQIRDQEYETQTLNSIKQDLLSDTRERHHRTVTIRQGLENNWNDAMHDKHQRDQEEQSHLKASQGILIHEQCDQYHRCAQCQRNLNNNGKTNFWKDTRYIPGTHIMV